MPRSSYTTLSKLTRLSYMPPNSVLSSWLIVVALVIDTGDFCFNDDSLPDDRTPSADRFQQKRSNHKYQIPSQSSAVSLSIW